MLWLGCGHLQDHVINFCDWTHGISGKKVRKLETSAQGGKKRGGE
jgi:hypothetical protein